MPRRCVRCSGDLDAAFRVWKDAFWSALYASLGLVMETVAPAEPLYSLQVLEEEHPNPFAEVYEASPLVVVEWEVILTHFVTISRSSLTAPSGEIQILGLKNQTT